MPSPSDLKAFLVASGIAVDAEQEGLLDIYLSDAIGWWEHETGWSPFIAVGSTESYSWQDAVFDETLGRSFISLRSGAVSVSSVEIGGVTLVEGEDFWLDPEGGDPIRRIIFAAGPASEFRGITVTGLLGCSVDWPSDAALAVLKRAASQFVEVALGVFGVGARVTQGPVSVATGASSGADASAPVRWDADAREVARRYRRYQTF